MSVQTDYAVLERRARLRRRCVPRGGLPAADLLGGHGSVSVLLDDSHVAEELRRV